MWWAFRKLGIEEWLVRLIQSMYENAISVMEDEFCRMHFDCTHVRSVPEAGVIGYQGRGEVITYICGM